MTGRLAWVGALVVFGLALGLWWSRDPQPGPSTELVIEITGGFAYVPTPADNLLEIAYLNDTQLREDVDTNGDGVTDKPNELVCDVDQIGTELMVLRGDIVVALPAPAPATRIFNLDGAVVTFPKLDNASIPLTITRKAWPPNPMKPVNVKDETRWNDLQYVPKITDHLTNKTLRPTWRNEVNGRVVLKGGAIWGTIPSDPTAQRAEFDFKIGGVLRGTAASTDKTIYKVTVPDDEIEILFSGSVHGFQRLVLKPTATNEPVRLRLRGLHAMSTGASLADGQELTDFCAFNALLQPLPKSPEFLRVYYKAPPAASAGGAQPSPGFFCDGNWF